MLDNQPTKSLLIFDPYTTNGFLLAQKLIPQGYTIQLFTFVKTADFHSHFSSLNLGSKLRVNNLSKGCNDNFLSGGAFERCEQIILMNSITDPKWFFDTTYDFDLECHIDKLKQNLYLFAKKNSISIVEPRIWHCSLETVDEIISRIFNFLYQDKEKRIQVNFLNCDLVVMDNTSYIKLLEKSVNNHQDLDVWHEIGNCEISFRDIFRMLFEELGTEIEFCGRGELEKGVIVDYDEDVMPSSKCFTSKIRLGNTVVKINEHKYNVISTIFTPKLVKANVPKSNLCVLPEVERLIKSKLCTLLKSNKIG